MRKILVFVMVLSLSVMLLGCSGTDTSKEAQDQILKLYYISDSEEIECAEIRTNLLQTTDIWNGLIGEGVLSSECKMNSCNVDQEQKTIDLDVDSGTGSYIRSMGTTGDECERFKITENGQPLETGHTVLKGYMTADE